MDEDRSSDLAVDEVSNSVWVKKKRKNLVALAEEGFQSFRHPRGGGGFCFVDGDDDFWPVGVDLKHLMMLVLAQIFMWVERVHWRSYGVTFRLRVQGRL
ncbi:hypothetical protein HanRHA438_Chr14g0657861 [Helianthus annuus]|nr:hypothetical protein HanRHA438_Chr14g0657861 [Helianthus annuus]